MIRQTIEIKKTPVPFLDLSGQDNELRDEVMLALQNTIESTHFVLGPCVEAFEESFAAVTGTRHCVAVNSGTSALHLALIAAGVGEGDEVITVPMTFVATSWAIRYVNARPVFVDVDPVTYTMDVNQVEARITSKTKAILPVHLYGQPADMGPLQELADRHGLVIVEDAAQAHGAAYQERPVGSMGHSGCFSFYPGKNLGAYGEGGAIVTNDDVAADRLRALRNHAQSERYMHHELGFNYRMDAFQGSVLSIKLRNLRQWTDQRRSHAESYRTALRDMPLTLPQEAEGRHHVWHLFVALHPERDQIRAALDKRGIQSGLHYPIPVHLQPAFSDLGYKPGDFPVSEKVGRECFSLPIYPNLKQQHVESVAEALSDYFN